MASGYRVILSVHISAAAACVCVSRLAQWLGEGDSPYQEVEQASYIWQYRKRAYHRPKSSVGRFEAPCGYRGRAPPKCSH